LKKQKRFCQIGKVEKSIDEKLSRCFVERKKPLKRSRQRLFCTGN